YRIARCANRMYAFGKYFADANLRRDSKDRRLLLRDLARQMGVDCTDLARVALESGLAAADPDAPLSKEDEFRLRCTMATGGGVSRPAWPLPQARPAGRRRREKPSEMTQRIFRVIRSQPKFGMGHSSVREDMARAETLAREWSKELFTPSEVEEWLRRLPQIDAKTASALRSAG